MMWIDAVEDARVASNGVDWSGCDLVECVEGRVGGAPVIRGTRLTVEAITTNYDSGLEPKQVASVFEIDVSTVEAVLAFREKQSARSA